MSLDLDQLPGLLSLPCFIDDKQILTQIPIFTTAEKLDENVYIVTVNESESLAQYLRRVYDSDGPYAMDCSVYAQLVSTVLSGTWPSNGGKLLIYIGAKFGNIMLWNNKIPEMGYIGVCDPEVSNVLTKIPTASKGQWCICLGPDKYFGLFLSFRCH